MGAGLEDSVANDIMIVEGIKLISMSDNTNMNFIRMGYIVFILMNIE